MLRFSASIDVLVPAGGLELCVQDGRRRGSCCCGPCCPAKPSFNHARPDWLPLSDSEWVQFQTKVKNAVAGMRSERALTCLMWVPSLVMVVVFLATVVLPFFGGELSCRFEDVGGAPAVFGAAIALIVPSVALGMRMSNHNERQDELISGACSELARASGGRLAANYLTFFTGPCRARGRKPHRAIVIAPSQQAHGAVVRAPAAAGVVVEPGEVAYAYDEGSP